MLDFTRLDKVRRQRPLIHCVSNIVTANDCANLALAVGASPMMAQAPEEMEAISAVSDATVLNTGTPDAEKFRACRICAVSARHPVVLDPVGVGASPWRLGQVRALLDLFTPSILRVNLGEARALLGSDGQEQGVDSPLPASQDVRRDTAMELARRLDVSRASLYRAFDALERTGAIRRTGKRIEVLSTAELEAAIETEPS